MRIFVKLIAWIRISNSVDNIKRGEGTAIGQILSVAKLDAHKILQFVS
jgi:hypothetical protein